MFLGRFLGWILLFVAVFTASAEAVAALETGEYISLATSDVLTIITGISPQLADTFPKTLLLWPAWVNIGLIGLMLIFLCRKKKYKNSFSVK